MKTKMFMLCTALTLSVTLTACGAKKETAPGAASGGAAASSEKLYELLVAFPGNEPKDLQLVQGEINKLIQPANAPAPFKE